MKTYIAVLFFIGCLFSATAQDKNDLLYEAIIKSDKATVEFQLAAGASPNYVKELSAWARISMLIAAVDHNNIEILKMLLDKKANVSFRDGFNTTAIIYAASNGEFEMVKLLVEYGANVNDNDGQGNSVLSAAKESQNADLIAFVISKGAK
ncbi:ankyrin repeat domain-containing protein [Cytophaga aurantiaca]|uniref:ankyrin repeat domain-containing protein n=1 Tax=Cytophaga aurantiaca TaxID=29530 RepID=UPI00037ADB30|nr:ankyrin repeat domain-containing protein [Cytophaga aurantiaca]